MRCVVRYQRCKFRHKLRRFAHAKARLDQFWQMILAWRPVNNPQSFSFLFSSLLPRAMTGDMSLWGDRQDESAWANRIG
jgi:hypothetical protein